MTKRIELPLGSANRHERRDRIADDVWRVSYLNYSLFLNLTYASDHLTLPLNSSFGDFYAHLGSVCDLAEDFLIAVYALASKCRNQPEPFRPPMTREAFLDIAGNWYDKDYPKLYEHYQKKGKMRPLYLPSRPIILEKYFGREDPAWKGYTSVADEIRPYRNKVVHDVAMGTVLVGAGKFHLVPRKAVIKDYGEMRPIQEAANDPERLQRDFVVREEQMIVDLRSVQAALNGVWEKPIADLSALLYEERNTILLQKYDLEALL